MNIYKIKTNIFIKYMIICITLMIGKIIFNEDIYLKFIIMLTMIMMIIDLIYFRFNNILFIFLIFLITYYIPLIQLYFFEYQLTPHFTNYIGKFDEKMAFIYCIFYLALSIAITNANKMHNIKYIDTIRLYDNTIIFWICIILIGIFTKLGHATPISLGTYAKGSTIYNEYIIIWFTMALVFANKNKYRTIVVYLMYGIYTIINFTYGDRIAVLQVGILIFIMNFNSSFNWKKIILCVIAVYLVFGVIDNLRGFKGNNNNQEIKYNIVVNNNQSQVFNSSVTILRMVDEKVVNLYDRISSFTQYVLRLCVSKSKLTDLADLTGYSLKYFPNQGGGLLPAFVYFWGGIIGVIFIGYIIGNILKIITSTKINSVHSLFAVGVITLIPRWIAYDPIQFIKIPMFILIIYEILKTIHKAFICIGGKNISRYNKSSFM